MIKKFILLIFVSLNLLSNNYDYNSYDEKRTIENKNKEKLKYEEKRNRVLQYEKLKKEIYDYKMQDFDFNSFEYAKIEDKKNINELTSINGKEKYDDYINNNVLYKDMDYYKTYGFDVIKEVFVDEDTDKNCNINDDFYVVNNSENIKELKKCINNNQPKLSGQYYFYGDVNDVMDFLAINEINIEKEFIFLFFSNQNLEKNINLLTYKSIRFLSIRNYSINSAIMVFPFGFLTEGKFYLKSKHQKEYSGIVSELQKIQTNNYLN